MSFSYSFSVFLFSYVSVYVYKCKKFLMINIKKRVMENIVINTSIKLNPSELD